MASSHAQHPSLGIKGRKRRRVMSGKRWGRTSMQQSAPQVVCSGAALLVE
jgi:hypothetical protein